jgi:hypothetical protein
MHDELDLEMTPGGEGRAWNGWDEAAAAAARREFGEIDLDLLDDMPDTCEWVC